MDPELKRHMLRLCHLHLWLCIFGFGCVMWLCLVRPLMADSGTQRTCTSPSGETLYRVQGDTVYSASGATLGTVRNGDVRLPNGTLIAHNGDAGLLLAR